MTQLHVGDKVSILNSFLGSTVYGTVVREDQFMYDINVTGKSGREHKFRFDKRYLHGLREGKYLQVIGIVKQ